MTLTVSVKIAITHRQTKNKMNIQEQYEQIKKKVVEAVPDIMELKFGCKVIDHVSNDIPTLLIADADGDKCLAVRCDNSIVPMWKKETHRNRFEILGRDINLEDILTAMVKNKVDIGVSVSFKGDYVHLFPQGATKKEEPILNTSVSVDTRQAQWNIGVPLHLQDLPTVQFIHNLLTK